MKDSDDSFLRLKHILGDLKANPPIQPLIPVSMTAWKAGVKSGIFPEPIRLSERIHVWRSSDIQNIIQRFNEKKGDKNGTA